MISEPTTNSRPPKARITATDVNDQTFSMGIGISRHFRSEPGGLDEFAGEADELALGHQDSRARQAIQVMSVPWTTNTPLIPGEIVSPPRGSTRQLPYPGADGSNWATSLTCRNAGDARNGARRRVDGKLLIGRRDVAPIARRHEVLE